METWLAWSIVMFAWSLLTFKVFDWLESEWGRAAGMLMFVGSIISLLFWATAAFLQLLEAWPFIPQ